MRRLLRLDRAERDRVPLRAHVSGAGEEESGRERQDEALHGGGKLLHRESAAGRNEAVGAAEPLGTDAHPEV